MDQLLHSLNNLATWHVRSAERSRVNALHASTALAGRRRERDDADAFLERHLAARAVGQDARSA